jgi:hypothetical protein
MELNNLSPEQVTELKDELSALSKKHMEALESAVYIRMNEKESDDYDQSGVRISELYGLLGNSRIAESDLGPRQEADGSSSHAPRRVKSPVIAA